MKKNVYLLVFLLSSGFLLNGQITLTKQEYDDMQQESTDCKKNVAQLKKKLTSLDKAGSSKKKEDLASKKKALQHEKKLFKRDIREKKEKIRLLEEELSLLKAAPSCDQLRIQISNERVWLKDTKDAVKKLSASSKEDKKQIESQEKEIAELQQEASRFSKKGVKSEDLNKCKTELKEKEKKVHYLKEKDARYKNKLSQQESIIDSLVLLTRGAFIPGYTDRTKVSNIIKTAESLLQKEYNLRTIAFSIAELKKVDNAAFSSQVNRLLPLLQNYCAKHIKTYDALHDIDKVRSITYRNQDIQTVLKSIVDYPYLTERVQLKVENITTKGSFLSKITTCN